MGGIEKHDIAQIHRRIRREDRSAEPLRVKKRQKTGMIDMRMCQEHIIDLAGGHRDRDIFKGTGSLAHAVVDQDIFARRLQQMAASGHFVVRSDKGQ